jgi:hypothetical protein
MKRSLIRIKIKLFTENTINIENEEKNGVKTENNNKYNKRIKPIQIKNSTNKI